MLVDGKNVQNEKSVGLLGQCDECWRRREFKEASWPGADPRRKTDDTHVSEERGNVATPHPAARGRLYSSFLNGNGGSGELSSPGKSASHYNRVVEESIGQKSDPLHPPSPGLDHGCLAVVNVVRTF